MQPYEGVSAVCSQCGDETAVKEVKELAAAMKELAAMRAALQKQSSASQAQAPPIICVAFSPDAEQWRE